MTLKKKKKKKILMQGVQNLFTATDVQDYPEKYTESGGLF